MDDELMQPEAPQPQLPPRPDRRKWVKWAVLGIGAGCGLLAAATLVVMLAARVLCQQGIAFLCVGGLTGTGIETVAPAVTSVPAEVVPSIQQSGNTLGDPNAPVRIVEYADFQCPFCRIYWQDTEPQIIEKYVKTGKVYYEYRSVGAYLGQESQAAAEAAYCAADQGKFWEYHDALFLHWTGENVGDFTPQKLQQYAASIGLDQPAFAQCLSSGKHAARVQQDQLNAQKDDIQGTPSFLVNGTLIEGAQPFSRFEQVIDNALRGN